MTDFSVVSKNASPEEIAAVTAVLQAALDELSESTDATRAPVSAWQRSQRNLRTTLRPGPGSWRGFSG